MLTHCTTHSGDGELVFLPAIPLGVSLFPAVDNANANITVDVDTIPVHEQRDLGTIYLPHPSYNDSRYVQI
jgi:hypothetical protein